MSLFNHPENKMNALNKILVIQTASIGDVILATPVLEKLHKTYPEAAIDLLIKQGNEGLFLNHPYLHSVITWDKSKQKFLHFFTLLSSIRSKKYDAVINLQRFALTGILTSFSGASIRIGFSKNPFAFLFTHKIPHLIREGIHEIDRNLSLLEVITTPGRMKPKLYPTNENETQTASLKTGRFITISPASLWFTKQYPAEKWIEFIRTVDPAIRIYLLGSASDSELCNRLIAGANRENIISLAGKLSLLDSASLMKDAIMNYTNDSAPMHLASAVNAPVTVVYCSTVPGFGFGPLSDDSTVVETALPLSCRPCGLHGFKKCPENHFLCALSIEVTQLNSRT
jgi:heptosyltransferase II